MISATYSPQEFWFEIKEAGNQNDCRLACIPQLLVWFLLGVTAALRRLRLAFSLTLGLRLRLRTRRLRMRLGLHLGTRLRLRLRPHLNGRSTPFNLRLCLLRHRLLSRS